MKNRVAYKKMCILTFLILTITPLFVFSVAPRRFVIIRFRTFVVNFVIVYKREFATFSIVSRNTSTLGDRTRSCVVKKIMENYSYFFIRNESTHIALKVGAPKSLPTFGVKKFYSSFFIFGKNSTF